MPGLSFVYSRDNDLDARATKILKGLRSLVHYQNYEHAVFVDTKSIFLGCTRHEKYPVTVLESDELLICVEGMMYGKRPDAIQKELEALSKSIFRDGGGYERELERWMLGTDGDFVVFMLHKGTGACCIFNDALARLPLYYHRSDGMLVVSREPRFIAALLDTVRFDRNAMAQYLLLGYVLGNGTIFKDIFQLAPGGIIRAGGAGGGIEVASVHRHNFELQSIEKMSVRDRAQELAEMFEEGCRNRHDVVDRSIVGLSGGMDSRMVASCLAKLGLKFSAITFQFAYYLSYQDIEIAQQVAGTLKADWRLFEMRPARGADTLELLRIKNGLNFLGMSFSVPLYRKIKEAFGDRITLFTGDGGDKVIRDIRPVGRIANIDALVRYVLATNQLLPLDIISAATGIDEADIVEGLRQHLLSYDETDMRLKYVHFIICDRCMKWHFQGEDRNRFVFWPVTPMYSMDFFRRVMECPFDLKRNYALFREILLLFSVATANIKNSKWNLPITSSRLRYYWMGREIFLRLPVPVRKFIRAHHWYRRRVSVYDMNSAVMRCLLEEFDNCEALPEILSADAIRRNVHRMDKMGFDHLFTLTSTIEDFTRSRSTIERYADQELL